MPDALTLAALLKSRQDIGLFPAPVDFHSDTVSYLAVQLSLSEAPQDAIFVLCGIALFPFRRSICAP